jgi:type VI secretion system secreted protein VgrG
MGSYSQSDRAFRVDTPLGEDELLLEGFDGQEQVSTPFHFTLELLSEKDSIKADDLLGQPVSFSVRLADDSDRYFHGIVNRFHQHGKSEDLTSYEAEVVPWFWFLSLTCDCRVFQNMTALDIIEEIFGKYPDADYQLKCIGTCPEREYCVQYRESDRDFVSRLMEEEGIYYFFEHSSDGHKLTLVDDPSMIDPCGVQSEYQVATTPEAWLEEDVITELRREHEVNTERVTLRDYDYLKPSNQLEASQGSDAGGEFYDYPGSYTELNQGERYATLLLEERSSDYEVVRGTSTCRTLTTGYSFDLKDYYIADANQKYIVIGAWHSAQGGGYRTGGPETTYTNQFECVPANKPYRPPRRTLKPVVQGSQTAVVVGPSGEEIYTDDHDRVKIQFHWDRLGGKDENSSCWVRVATPWAGKGYGSVSIPRIDNEVLVDFLEGDPDRPIVVGSVYNADQTPPTGNIEQGIKSRSSKGGGGYNQITVEDSKGKEVITIHGQFDMNTTVEHDQTESVGNDQTESVGHDRKRDVGNNETIKIGSNLKSTVGKNENATVMLTRTRMVGVNESINVGAAQEVTVGAARALTVGVDQSTDIGNNLSLSVGDTRTGQIGKDDMLQVGKNLVIDAGDQITVKTGKASITMKKDGTIAISGKDISIKGSGKIDVKASKNITMKGKKILQN